MRRRTNDRHLGPPAEANRDKHINFVALENRDLDPAHDFADERGARRKTKKKQPASHHPGPSRRTGN